LFNEFGDVCLLCALAHVAATEKSVEAGECLMPLRAVLYVCGLLFVVVMTCRDSCLEKRNS